jgi:hypothetical protein
MILTVIVAKQACPHEQKDFKLLLLAPCNLLDESRPKLALLAGLVMLSGQAIGQAPPAAY